MALPKIFSIFATKNQNHNEANSCSTYAPELAKKIEKLVKRIAKSVPDLELSSFKALANAYSSIKPTKEQLETMQDANKIIQNIQRNVHIEPVKLEKLDTQCDFEFSTYSVLFSETELAHIQAITERSSDQLETKYGILSASSIDCAQCLKKEQTDGFLQEHSFADNLKELTVTLSNNPGICHKGKEDDWENTIKAFENTVSAIIEIAEENVPHTEDLKSLRDLKMHLEKLVSKKHEIANTSQVKGLNALAYKIWEYSDSKELRSLSHTAENLLKDHEITNTTQTIENSMNSPELIIN